MTRACPQNFNRLIVWKRNDERAPHKPLLALWAIGRCLEGKARLFEYETVHNELLLLLNTFGPRRRSHKPQEPFWRMQKDRIWEIPQADRVPEHSNGSVSPSTLRKLRIVGGFPAHIYNLFRHDKELALKISIQLVKKYFHEKKRFAVLEATLGESVIKTFSDNAQLMKLKSIAEMDTLPRRNKK